MNWTIHSLERYCHRVLKMSEIESKNYIKQNKDEVQKEANNMFEESIWFWHGSYNDTFKESDYYFHKDGFIFIIEKDAIISIYITDYGFDIDIDLKIAKDLFNKMIKLKQRNDKILLQEQYKIAKNEIEIENIKNQILLLELQKNKLISEKDTSLKEIEIKEKEFNDTALKLINSMQFRMELISLKNKKIS